MKTICPYCGLKKVEYNHSLSRVVIALVVELYKAGRPSCATKLVPELSARTNAYKNQFWGFIAPHVTPETERKRGWWALTSKGQAFVEGRISVSKVARTVNSEVLEYSGPQVFIKDLLPEYQYVGEWKDQARQQILFDEDSEE